MGDISPEKVKEKIARMKFYPDEKTEKFDRLDKEINDLFSGSSSPEDIEYEGEKEEGIVSLEGIGKETASHLFNQGYDTPEKIIDAGEEVISRIKGIGPKKAASIIEQLKNKKEDSKE